MRPTLRRTVLPALGALCATAALSAAATDADAAAVTREADGTLVYTAAPGEVNPVGVQLAYDEVGIVLYDSNGNMTSAPDGCVLADGFGGARTVTCASPPPAIRLDLGDGDEWQTVSTDVRVPVTVLGGPGNDRVETGRFGGTLDGGPGNDVMDGDRGDDTLRGGDGNDTIEGEAGSDHVDGGAGEDLVSGDGYEGQYADVIDGGPGVDRIEIDFSDRTYDYVQPHVTVTLGGGADDGRPGEGDDVRNVEALDLGLDADVVGTDAPERIEFHQITKPVRIEGAGGDDELQGGEGADTVSGGAGNDLIDASFGDDTVDPGPGRDTVSGDLRGGDCSILLWCKSPYGNDTILARDGEVDSIDCGVGTDRVVADADDVVAPNCETVERAAGPQGSGPGGGGAGGGGRGAAARATLRPSGARLRAALSGGLVVRVGGVRPGARVALAARRGGRVVARGSARANRAGTARVVLRFTRAARRSLRGARLVRLTVTGAGARVAVALRR